MAKKTKKKGKAPRTSSKQTPKLISRLMRPMLLLVVLQVVTFFVILTVGGAFTYVRRYAYSTLVEKTENRKNYIETELQQKVPFVQEYAEKINAQIARILAQQGLSAGAIQESRQVNQQIMEEVADNLIELLRRSLVNDVFLLLDTGDLYAEDGGNTNAVAGLYLRDLDPMTDAGSEDLLMELGFSSISRSLGIALDSGWSLHFEPDPKDESSYDFYYKTLKTARENPTVSLDNLGYWSAFTKLSRSSAASMRYSLPLIAKDGTVYGVIGIGLTENTILSRLPSTDFMSESACYVLGRSLNNNRYHIFTHSGSIYRRLVGNAEILPVAGMIADNVCDFDLISDIKLAGNVQAISLYDYDSPYYSHHWALICVADRASVLRPLWELVHMLVIAAVTSFAVSIMVMIFSSRKIVRPITSAIKTMNNQREFNQVIRFEPSNIYEFDKMTDAITQLQINVQDFSSQVSQMIRIVDVGLGTFMYDRTDDSVFVGQSLLKLMKHPPLLDEDVMMRREEFIDGIIADETRHAVVEGLNVIPNEDRTNFVKEYSITQPDGTTLWMRLSLVRNKNKSIGILQDITGMMMEKKRIEYERDYDNTTGLLNRHAYYNILTNLFQNPEQLKVTAFIMLDLDNLKYVNDTYGHDFGDDYIKTAATSLKYFQHYGGIVSRLSGDEFSVCLPGFSSKDEVRAIIDNVRSRLLQSHCLLADGTHYKIRASAGIAWYPDDAKTYEVLMRYADFAMYTIKHSTKGAIAEFDMSTYEMDSVLLTGVEEMNRIIDEGGVKYAFQSIVSAKTGEIFGYEALMRPQSSIFQSPLDLLRTAKTSAKLYEIERLTWTKALTDFQAQIDAGHIAPDCKIFINSISNSVLDTCDVDAIEAAHPNLLPHVVLEILETENVNENYITRKIGRMKKWNALVALDDFGTGYNSEYALITMQPNLIKIDRSIISGCDKDISRRTIITNLVKLARTKQILVLAEGVETEAELKTVIACGIDLMQGYYFNRPLFEPQPISEEITELIRRINTPAAPQKTAG